MNGGFSFSINGGSTDNNCYGAYMDLMFMPSNDSGAAIATWTAIYVDIMYMSADANGYAYLQRGASTYWQDVELPALSGLTRCYGLREQLGVTAMVWMLANLGRPLYIVVKNATSNPTILKMYTAKVEYDSMVYNELLKVKDRTAWVRNDIENVVFPRLRRLLSLLGENTLLDNFSYDNAGNITGLRVRCFDSAANASNATVDVTDAENGEEVTLVVTQTHDLPRNVRSSHLSVASSEAVDRTASRNDITDVVEAPGNTGTWPS